MSSLARPTGREMVRALERAGFVVERTRGSHYFLRHSDGRVTVVPLRTRTLGPGAFTKDSVGLRHQTGAVKRFALIGSQRRHIDGEPVLHIGLQQPLVGLRRDLKANRAVRLYEEVQRGACMRV